MSGTRDIKDIRNKKPDTNPNTGPKIEPDIGPDENRDTPRDKNRVAVALAYDPGNEDAPRLSAKGQGLVADQIIEVAIDHGVEIREDADLAQILSQLDVDSVIPVEVFATVAEILTYVYSVNRDKQDKLALARGDIPSGSKERPGV